ncbi:MAG: hypothetical protein JSR91_12235 [Proteobacteria bacterium]|nr:hypothetical protein [Pseudomonadota bacterium]
MSDYNNRDPYDPYRNRFEPADNGRGPYILLAILVAIGVIGGLLYFNHKPVDQNEAQAPSATESPTAPKPTPLPSPPGSARPGGATAPSTTSPGTDSTGSPGGSR